MQPQERLIQLLHDGEASTTIPLRGGARKVAHGMRGGVGQAAVRAVAGDRDDAFEEAGRACCTPPRSHCGGRLAGPPRCRMLL